MKKLTLKEKKKFWKEFWKHRKEDPSANYIEIMLNAYYQKQFKFIRKYFLGNEDDENNN